MSTAISASTGRPYGLAQPAAYAASPAPPSTAGVGRWRNDPGAAADDGADRVIRGGSWVVRARGCRAAVRDALHPTSASSTMAFALPEVRVELEARGRGAGEMRRSRTPQIAPPPAGGESAVRCLPRATMGRHVPALATAPTHA